MVAKRRRTRKRKSSRRLTLESKDLLKRLKTALGRKRGASKKTSRKKRVTKRRSGKRRAIKKRSGKRKSNAL